MKIAFILSEELHPLVAYKKEFINLSFVNLCVFYIEEYERMLDKATDYDFIFYDTELAALTGKRFFREFREMQNKPVVILLVNEFSEKNFKKVHQHGFSGLVKKEGQLQNLVTSLVSMLTNYSLHFGTIHKSVPSNLSYALLTERERQILKLFVNGFSYKEVGYQLDVKLDTVRSHIRNIYRKLNVRSKTEAVMKVIDTAQTVS